MFIAVEGIDGSGKTTLAKGLERELGRTHRVFLTKEPTNSSILDRESVNTPADALSLFFLFVHDRFMHQDIIERKIGEGYVVISDRYDLSSFCYQGPPMEVLFGSMEATLDWMVSVSRVIRVIPDITFLIDVDVDTALERLSIRRTRSAFESRALLERVRSYYLHMAGMRRDCVVLDGKVGKGELLRKAVDEVSRRMSPGSDDHLVG
ncbi:thymidylate kinase [Thermogymnomonas acidicola]|uniref:Probable thymidylate kinase n=1 Tax=Thermogymnomonas acidicola TaxID=399579 RepID=A0AA37BQ43_9ARCH|nr:dTMP kinase [Thermogymnomonas acidicola]GGM68932.1 thymidylate kinase [Thermogymnomonas acidicola]